MLLTLVYFTGICSLVFLSIRKYMRSHRDADKTFLLRFEHLRNKTTDKVMLLFTYLGKHIFLIPANIIIIAFSLTYKNVNGFPQSLFLISLSSLLLMFFLKHIFRRKRPPEPLFSAAKGNSFPSGHAIMAVNFFGFLCFMLLQLHLGLIVSIAVILLFSLLIFLVGFSRIYLKVHYGSDVFAGFLVGAVWLYISIHLLTGIGALVI